METSCKAAGRSHAPEGPRLVIRVHLLMVNEITEIRERGRHIAVGFRSFLLSIDRPDHGEALAEEAKAIAGRSAAGSKPDFARFDHDYRGRGVDLLDVPRRGKSGKTSAHNYDVGANVAGERWVWPIGGRVRLPHTLAPHDRLNERVSKAHTSNVHPGRHRV